MPLRRLQVQHCQIVRCISRLSVMVPRQKRQECPSSHSHLVEHDDAVIVSAKPIHDLAQPGLLSCTTDAASLRVQPGCAVKLAARSTVLQACFA